MRNTVMIPDYKTPVPAGSCMRSRRKFTELKPTEAAKPEKYMAHPNRAAMIPDSNGSGRAGEAGRPQKLNEKPDDPAYEEILSAEPPDNR